VEERVIEPTSANEVDRDNPWPGLESYSEAAQQYFCGRAPEIDELSRRVKQQTLTILFGESGLGKTSLLQAGLFPKLRRDAFLPVYVRLAFGSGSPPLSEQVKNQLTAAIQEARLECTPGLDKVTTVWQWLHLRDSELCDDFGRDVIPVLVFDQFEEIFTLGRTVPKLVSDFIAELGDLAENSVPGELAEVFERDPTQASSFDFRRANLRVLMSLREDYLPQLEELRSVIPSLMQNRMRLTRMNGGQALEAVLGPGGHLLSREVAVAIVLFVSGGKADDLTSLEIVPPLLSLVCRELNERRRASGQSQITGALLEGTRSEILANFYERCMEGQPAAVRAFVEDELMSESGYRENVTLERAVGTLTHKGAPPDALERLVKSRLLRIDERLGVPRVELTHDVLAEVVLPSRRTRHEREEKQKLEQEKLRADADAHEARQRFREERRKAHQLRVLAFTAVTVAIAALVLLYKTYRAEVDAKNAHAALADSVARETEERHQFYDATIELANQSWKDGDISRVRKWLRESRHASKEDSGRWDWNYIEGLVHINDFGSLASLPLQTAVRSLVFIPGNKSRQVAVRTDDGTVKVFDLHSGGVVSTLPLDVEEVFSVGISFEQRQDGALIVNEVYAGTPAANQAHLNAGDLIVGISDSSGAMNATENLTIDQARGLLNGPTGTSVRLSLISRGSTKVKTVEIKRKKTTVKEGVEVRALAANECAEQMSPEGKCNRQLFLGDADGQLLSWDQETRKVTVSASFGGAITSLAVSPDGDYLAISQGGGKPLLVLPQRPGAKPIMMSLGKDSLFCGFAFSPEAGQIAVAGNGGVTLFDIASDKPLRTVPLGITSCQGLAFSHSGDQLVILVDGRVGIVDLNNRSKPWWLSGQAYVTAFALSPDGRYIAVTDSGSVVIVYELNWGMKTAESRLTLRGHSAPATAVAFSPDGRMLVTGGLDKTIVTWHLRAESLFGTQSAVNARSIADYSSFPTEGTTIDGVAFSPDGRLIAATTPFAQNPSVTVYDSVTMQRLVPPFAGTVRRLNFSPDGRLLAIPDDHGTIRIYDIYSGKQTKELRRHSRQVDAVEFSPDGRYLASASQDGTALIWDLSTDKPRELVEHSQAVTAITFSPDSRLVATGSLDDRAVRLYETANGHMRWTNSTPFALCLRFSSDGKMLISGELAGPLSLWRIRDGTLAGRLFGHTSWVYDAALSPDGSRLVTVAEDRTIRLWSVPRKQEMLELDSRASGRFYAAAFSPDGLRLVTTGDQEVRLWDAALLGQPPRQVTPAYYAARGVEFARFGRWHNAIDDLANARKLLPPDDTPLAKRYRALILRLLANAEAELGTRAKQNDYLAKAMADYGAALTLTPEDPRIVSTHATLALFLGRMTDFAKDEGLEANYAKSGAADSDSAVWANAAAWDYALTTNMPSSEAAQLIAMQRKAVEQSPDNYAFLSTLACLICRAGPTEECFDDLKKAMEMNKSVNGINEPNGTPFEWVFMALASAQRGKFDEADRWLKQTDDHMARVSADPLYNDPKYSWDWSDELELEILRREVKTELAHQPPAGDGLRSIRPLVPTSAPAPNA
jgi:WD40 repeat protein